MTPSAWIALGFGVVSLIITAGSVAIGYGILKATVSGLNRRVEALEVEISAINDLKVVMAEIRGDIRNLSDRLGWLAEVPGYGPRRKTPPKGGQQ